jgi:hypothetical protein
VDRLQLAFLDRLVAAVELKPQLGNLKDPPQPRVLGNTLLSRDAGRLRVPLRLVNGRAEPGRS